MMKRGRWLRAELADDPPLPPPVVPEEPEKPPLPPPVEAPEAQQPPPNDPRRAGDAHPRNEDDVAEVPSPQSLRGRNRPTVFVFGAGIAGLTAAHELAERGFDVTVYEPSLDPRDPAPPEDDPLHPHVRLGGMAATQFYKPEELRLFPGNRRRLEGNGLIPGEHGFRFFPAYYLHIWDTLRRIPIYATGTNDAGEPTFVPTPLTVYDNVKRVVAEAGTAPGGQPALVIPREAPRSLSEFLGSLQEMWSVGYTPSDLSSFSSRIARYLVTSQRRREDELEELSTYDYLVGMNSATNAPDYTYSDAFHEQIIKMPRILAAFDARWGDARTNLNVFIQLNMSLDRYDTKADGVLDGPPTTAWFDPWYVHLRRLGVKFRHGALRSFRFQNVDGEGQTLHAVVAKGEEHAAPQQNAIQDLIARDAEIDEAAFANDVRGGGEPMLATYYVVATDAFRAELATSELRAHYYRETENVEALFEHPENEKVNRWRQYFRNLSTVIGLDGFTTSRPPEEEPRGKPRMGYRNPMNIFEVGDELWDRFQTLTGIQFFFDTEFQILNGHVYYSTSEWGLSSINQTGLWRDRPLLARQHYGSIMSVDIGNWRVRSTHINKSAMECTPSELAEEVWYQISTELGESYSDEDCIREFPRPKWFVIDKFIEYDEHDHPIRNHCPYLVPIKADWKNRPGAYPWSPNGSSPTWLPREKTREQQELLHVWQARHGGYQVHEDKLVFAGTWCKTFTRMTSMEAACESGRHAVNAILDHFVSTHSPIEDDRAGDPLEWKIPYGFVDQELSSPIRFPTPAGDYCFVYDCENREPSDARPTRFLDAEYFVQGFPHPWTLNGIDQISATASGVGPYGALANMYDPVWIVEQLRRSRQVLEMVYRPAPAPGAPPAKPPGPPGPQPPGPLPGSETFFSARSPNYAGLYCRSALLPTDENSDPVAAVAAVTKGTRPRPAPRSHLVNGLFRVWDPS